MAVALKTAREILGLNKSEFARTTNLSLRTYSRAEQGEPITQITADKIEKYIKIFSDLGKYNSELGEAISQNLKSQIVQVGQKGKASSKTTQRVIDDSSKPPTLGVTFPEEYFQAGTNLLGYFSTYLRKNYPGENAKVSIIQDGLKVSLIIDCDDGTTDRIEELLSDYLDGVTGIVPLDEITNSDLALLDLRQQLTLSKATIENQNMLLSYKHAEVKSLQTILLSAVSNTPALTIKPTNTTNVVFKVKNDNHQLQSDFRRIQEHLELLDNNESRAAAMSIGKAAEALKVGDDSALRIHLKAASKYALETTTKIGVPVAQAFIKDWLGLGR